MPGHQNTPIKCGFGCPQIEINWTRLGKTVSHRGLIMATHFPGLGDCDREKPGVSIKSARDPYAPAITKFEGK